MLSNQHRRAKRALCAITVGVLGIGLTAGAAGAQSSSTEGVTKDSVKLGFIWSGTGVAAPNFQDSGKACQARVDAQNAKGGVNGRKIQLETVDDMSSGANLTGAHDLVENRKVFAVVNNSSFAFLSYRYLQGAGVPLIGGGFDGNYYSQKGNENIIDAGGNGSPPPAGIIFTNATDVAKKLGATKIGSVGYGVSPSSSGVAKDTQKYAAAASGLKPVYLNTAVDFGSTDVGPDRAGAQERRGERGVPAPRRQHEPRHRAGPPAERRAHEGDPDGVGLRAGHARLAHHQDAQLRRRGVADLQARRAEDRPGGEAVPGRPEEVRRHHRRARLRRLHRVHRLRPGHHRSAAGGEEPDPPGLHRRPAQSRHLQALPT